MLTRLSHMFELQFQPSCIVAAWISYTLRSSLVHNQKEAFKTPTQNVPIHVQHK